MLAKHRLKRIKKSNGNCTMRKTCETVIHGVDLIYEGGDDIIKLERNDKHKRRRETKKKNNKKTSKILKLSYRIVIVSPLILGLVLVSKIDHLGFVSDPFFERRRDLTSRTYIYT